MSKRAKVQPTAAEIGHLQKTLLEAVLLREALPGTNQPVNFADLAFVFNQPEVLVADENLAGPVSITRAPIPVRVLPLDKIIEQAHRTRDQVTFLQFHQPQVSGESVQLTLEAKIVPQDPKQLQLGLSGVQVTFRKVDGHWLADELPSSFAS